MSSYYGLNHIVNECLDEKAKVATTARGKNPAAKTDIYHSSFQALNTWIESRLAKQKGAGISGFGCFCWELKQKDGVTNIRPLFILSDSFVKSFQIKQQRVHHPPQTTAVEEVNYSLLAIKYSKKLTKDMVFSGVRDVLRKLGDFIYRGYEMEIAFSFGTLRAKERRVKFEFNQSRLQQILPEKMEPGTYSFDTTYMAYVEEESDAGDATARDTASEQGDANWGSSQQQDSSRRSSSALPSLNLSMKNLATLQTQQDQRASTALPPRNEAQPQTTQSSFDASALMHTSSEPNFDNSSNMSDYGSNAPSMGTGTIKSFEQFEREMNHKEALPSDLRDLLSTLANKKSAEEKKIFRQKAVDRVTEQAYMRCLEAVDDHARLDDNVLHESTAALSDWKDSLHKQREDARAQIDNMRSSLDAQVARNAEKAERERQDKKLVMMRFILPENAGMAQSALGASLGPDGKVINGRQKINKDLEAQMRSNAESKQRAKEESTNKERDYLKRLSVEIEMHSAMQRAQHLETQKMMLEAWEREGHIKNLRKLQPHGRGSVQDYIETNLAETTGALTINNASNTIGSAINKSIGYDPRRGRIV